MKDANRRTGRTTRMMEEAKALARAGRAVYVILGYQAHKRHWKTKKLFNLASSLKHRPACATSTGQL